MTRGRHTLMPEIPDDIRRQLDQKGTEGLALALASRDDGAVMVLQWCNKAFTRITGYQQSEVVGQRGTLLIGGDMDQSSHLHIIEKLMRWEDFAVTVRNNRKDGERYLHRMSWTHLSDAMTGQRWWLCSLVELDAGAEHTPENLIQGNDGAEAALSEKISLKIQSLEKENARLHVLAKEVAKDANEDALTRLSNRRHFEIELKSWVDELRLHGTDFAVLYVDLDHFKLVNDTLGHEMGDRLLVRVSDILRGITEVSDLVARIGGDEFVILRKLGSSALNISGLADEIVQCLDSPITIDGNPTNCSASVGVAIASGDMAFPEQVVADSDVALYHAKSQGGARWSFFTEQMHADSVETRRLASSLLFACQKKEFSSFLQPIIDLSTGKLESVEVLARWHHPEKGVLSPDVFLETAAKIGILKKIDEIIFNGLAETLAPFKNTDVELPRIAINVSSGRLADPTFIHDIKRSGIDPGRFIVEILESVYLDRMGPAVARALNALDELGVTVAIDDFGTAHASVQGLVKIKPEILKIDRQFIQPMVHDDSSRALVSSIIGIGKSLGIKIVAEGVETENHAVFVREMGCDYAQGFFFSEPLPAADLLKQIEQNQGQFWQGV